MQLNWLKGFLTLHKAAQLGLIRGTFIRRIRACLRSKRLWNFGFIDRRLMRRFILWRLWRLPDAAALLSWVNCFDLVFTHQNEVFIPALVLRVYPDLWGILVILCFTWCNKASVCRNELECTELNPPFLPFSMCLISSAAHPEEEQMGEGINWWRNEDLQVRLIEPITDSSGIVHFFDVPRWANSNTCIYSFHYGNNLHDNPVRWRNVWVSAAGESLQIYVCWLFSSAGPRKQMNLDVPTHKTFI